MRFLNTFRQGLLFQDRPV